MEESTSGLLVNHNNIIDAVIKRSEGMEILYDNSYRSGDAIQCSIPNKEMVRFTIPKQEMTGPYVFKTFWKSEVQDTDLLNIQILQDACGNI